jgi:zinc/manganese transport system substrate-binding protein
MKRLITALVVSTLLAAAPAAGHAAIEVIATVPTLAALAREVGGEHVRVTSMSLPTQDPHFVDAKPSLALALNRADLLVAVGLDLEVGWLPTLQTGARNTKIQVGGRGYLDCSVYAAKKDTPTTKIDRSMGDIHPGGNPHYLYEPRNVRRCASAIAARLSTLEPAHAKAFRANLAAFERGIDERIERWEKRLAPLRGAPVVTYHRSWVYLLDWLGLREVATLEPKPGIPPSARHVAQVIKAGRASKAKVVLQESYYPEKTSRLVAQKIGATVLHVPSGPDFAAGQSYVEYLDAVLVDLARALES